MNFFKGKNGLFEQSLHLIFDTHIFSGEMYA
jgi:hypothetical protein